MGLVLSAATAAQFVPRRPWVGAPVSRRSLDAPLLQEVRLLGADERHAALGPPTAGVLRDVWHSRYGDMLIEVRGDETFVNGQRVERHQG